MTDIDELIAGHLAERRDWFDGVIAHDLRELIIAAQGLEHIPRVMQIIRERRAKLTAWRDTRLAGLEAALLAEVRRREDAMDEVQAGRIVAISHDADGNPIFIDHLGRSFVTTRGEFLWRPLPSPADPVKPPPSRWRRAAA